MKLRLLLSLFAVCFIFSCANKNNIFTDPAVLTDKVPVYQANGEFIKMPTFFRLPPNKQNISFKFEKQGNKPAQLDLTFTVDGWRTTSGTTFPLDKAGIIIDFFSGKIYEMPKNETDKILNNFTANQVSMIDAVRVGGDPSTFLKMAVVDAQFNYGKDELKYLNVINNTPDSNIDINNIDPEPTTDQTTRVNLNKNVIVVGKPVITAAANAQYDRLVLLLSEGKNINEIEDSTGDNALIKALKNGSDDVANLLLDRGINPNVANKAGQTALHVSSDTGFYDLSRRLLDAGLNPNAKDNSGNTPLMYAAASPNPYLANLLIERNASIEDKNRKGETPLEIAALSGNTKTVEELITKGANVNTSDNEGNGVVMKAVASGSRRTLKSLLSVDAPSDKPNNNEVRPIHEAVKRGKPEIADDLLNKGVDVNAKDFGGNTPIMLAAEKGDSPMAEVILAHNPDLTLKNKEDKTAYAIAREKGHQRVQRVLANAMEQLDNMTVQLFKRVAANDVEGAVSAVESGAIINGTDLNTGNTPIFTAAANNYDVMTSKLIALGADVNHKNAKNNTPLIVAVSSSSNAAAKIIIRSGAKVNIQNSNGDTALTWAAKLKNIDLVRVLLTAGADPNLKNNDGVSAYLIAYNEGPQELADILQAAGGRK